MEKNISAEDIEGVVCTELPIQVFEIKCGGSIVCETCGPKLKGCIYRCEPSMFKVEESKFIQRMINDIEAKCKFCSESFKRSELLRHVEDGQNSKKAYMMIPNLHDCKLYRTNLEGNWFGDGRYLKKHGCLTHGKAQSMNINSSSWHCKKGDVDYCDKGTSYYSSVDDTNEFEAFSKNDNEHISHVHTLRLWFAENLSEAEKSRGYGKNKPKGCQNVDKDTRYFKCDDCNTILGEKGYIQDDFWIKLPDKTHKHPVHLQSVALGADWSCDSKLDKCNKISLEANQLNHECFRCDQGDYDVCFECTDKVMK